VSSGRLCQHTGTSDNEDQITAIARQGFTHLAEGKFNLQFTLSRLNYNATGVLTCAMQIDVDFQEYEITAQDVTLSSEGGGGAWDNAWDTEWGFEAKVQLRWQKIKGFGKAVAPVVKLKSTTGGDWFATDLMYALGGSL
jgi:hypothetical protein